MDKTKAKTKKKTPKKVTAKKKTIAKKKAESKEASNKKATPKAKAKMAKKKAVKKPAVHKGVFAVIETGGKQYKVSPGEILVIEKLNPSGRKKEYKEGDKITFDKILLTDDGKDTKIGTPYLDGVKIEAEFAEEGRGKKLNILRFRAKSRHRRRVGHRQPYTKVKITAIK